MDKRLLQNYSVWAKENLEAQIEVSLKAIGINGDNDIKSAKVVGDFTVIDGDSNSYPASLFQKRDRIVNDLKQKSYRTVIEEFAYTWFNRLVALRFMEVHDFLPHGFRVLSDRHGGVEPEILKNLAFVKDELHLDMARCEELKAQNRTEELFRHVLLRQCNALADILPMLFEKGNDYLELLLPKVLLIGETVLTKLLEIPEENFLNDVEIIGWMYQFYISAKKDAVFASKKTITKDTLPAVTQLFTPEWIVRYMTENSVGRLWLESYPDSPLRNEMKYYVEDAPQTEEVQKQLDAIRYRNVNPEDIRVIEPCCGSGHIIVNVFDLLYRMYEEKGHSAREIPTLVLKNNIVGLDVDRRAAQLASFALVMKARTKNSRFFNETYYTSPQIVELQESKLLEDLDFKGKMDQLGIFTMAEKVAIRTLVETFRHGKTIGSLTKVPPMKYDCIESAIQKLKTDVVSDIFNASFVKEAPILLKALLRQAKVLADKYDVMITNPPYIGTSTMETPVKEYATKYYPNSKTDMFAMFMETDLVKNNGFTAMINLPSWMFLSSYETFRKILINNNLICNMLHLGRGIFGSDFGTTSFVLKNNYFAQFTGSYKRLFEKQGAVDRVEEKELKFFNHPVIQTKQDNFSKIPGSPIAYWVKKINIFDFEKLGSIYKSGGRNKTHNNEIYVRKWWEISNKAKWAPYANGGEYRKWYGNHFDVVDWSESAKRNYASHGGLYNPIFWGKEGICWNLITITKNGFRIKIANFHFSSGSPTIISNNKKQDYLRLGFLNTRIAEKLINIINPTINTTVGDIMTLPYKCPKENENRIFEIVAQNIKYSQSDWDSFETSWDFQRHPLTIFNSKYAATVETIVNDIKDIHEVHLLQVQFHLWKRECEQRFNQLKSNEEELNRLFIEIYGLQDELAPDVEDKDVTVRLADKERDVKSLISYLIGVIMGRYSLDTPGLAYAGGDWDATKYVTYRPDDDGIVPIYTHIGMEDGLDARIIELIKKIYGEESYHENIDFIAEALGKAKNESSEETLNRYLNDGFYADHLKIYQKRPIYWLFSSGKYGGFKCLIYMHRYTEDTLARINGRYFLPESTRLKSELEELQTRLASAEGRDAIRMEKERQKLSATYHEAIEYGQVLDHVANQYIAIDLDDGVKVNYAKFQGVELVTDSGMKVKKDLLSPIK